MFHAYIPHENQTGGTKMEDKKDGQKEFSTCLEDAPFAEMMQRTAESPFSRFQDGKGALRTEKNPKNGRPNMLESIMNLHRCEDCAIRRKAAAKPRSFLARAHCWHATWWPGWKMYQAELRGRKTSANIQFEENR
jgi:hypothetical protein